MYSCVFWCEFIDLVGFFWYCLTPVTIFIIRILLYLIYRKMSKNNDTKRSQTSVFYYFICHRKSQRLLATRHRLSCEKANLHNTFVT